jgi:Spy/CpxP family protein refolding chaperone
MFGFLIGTLSLIGLVKVSRWGRWGRGRYGARRWMMRRLFQELDTTPGQEKVILEVADELEKKGSAAREAFFSVRSEFSRSVRGEHFDGAAVDASFEKQQAAVDELKAAAREGMRKIHEALNPEQRKRAADLLEYGPRAMGHGCGHHGRMHHHGMHHGGSHGPQTVNL